MARLRRQSPAGMGDWGSAVERGTHNKLHPASFEGKRLGDSGSKCRTSPRKKAARSYDTVLESSDTESQNNVKLLPKPSSPSPNRGKQVRLAPLNSLSNMPPLSLDLGPPDLADKARKKVTLASPRKPKFKPLSFRATPQDVKPAENLEASEDSLEVAVEESIWCGSDRSSDETEDGLPSPRKFLRLPNRSTEAKEGGPSAPSRNATKFPTASSALDLAPLQVPVDEGPNKVTTCSTIQSRPGSSSDKENKEAFLCYSPPRLFSPSKQTPKDRPVTPPQSPARSKLQSPSKIRTTVPTPPGRQSLDAFWNPKDVNEWNDQYSPRKVLKSPSKSKMFREATSPTSSPRKCQSPSKRTKAEVEAKKNFEDQKRQLAETFLTELDSKITDGNIRALAAITGGVHFIWSKTLNSTAGRANWRRETTKSRELDGSTKTTDKHHASIELAEKVIDDENRLLNVIAHEFCHLANFMISGIKDQPHGRQFKDWGSKVTKAFGERGVEVTTKHSYQIEYKYIWQCSNEDCAVEFKRHSRSIDPKRHTCGTCRSGLVQVKPAPRKDAGKGTGYAAYVKVNFALVKKDMPCASQKELMEALGRRYREDKASSSLNPGDKAESGDVKQTAEVDEVARVLEFVTIDDD